MMLNGKQKGRASYSFSAEGFTLIELLIVIAIIGILAVIVLVGLQYTRSKASESKIKSSFGQLRNLAEVFYSSNCSSYQSDDTCAVGAKDLSTCFTKPDAVTCAGGIENAVKALKTDVKNIGVIVSPTEYCISGALDDANTKYVCADFTGKFKEGVKKGCVNTSCP